MKLIYIVRISFLLICFLSLNLLIADWHLEHTINLMIVSLGFTFTLSLIFLLGVKECKDINESSSLRRLLLDSSFNDNELALTHTFKNKN